MGSFQDYSTYRQSNSCSCGIGVFRNAMNSNNEMNTKEEGKERISAETREKKNSGVKFELKSRFHRHCKKPFQISAPGTECPVAIEVVRE